MYLRLFNPTTIFLTLKFSVYVNNGHCRPSFSKYMVKRKRGFKVSSFRLLTEGSSELGSYRVQKICRQSLGRVGHEVSFNNRNNVVCRLFKDGRWGFPLCQRRKGKTIKILVETFLSDIVLDSIQYVLTISRYLLT